jgi:hypothetical protein
MKNIATRRTAIMTVLVLCCFTFALRLATTVSSEGPRKAHSAKSNELIRMFEVGADQRFSFQLGRETTSHYLGTQALQEAMQTGNVEPRALVSDDFNGDGMADLVIGYAHGREGIVSLRIGNVQAIAPTDRGVFEGIQQGRYPSPFLNDATLYRLPETPDFLQVGDFNVDGYQDVLAAARGGATLYLLAGAGRGKLLAPQSFEIQGSLTALQADDFKQPGKFTRLALGVTGLAGPKTLVYDDRGLSATPESYPMSGEVSALAFGQLDDDVTTDLAVATGSDVTVIHGRGEPATTTADGLPNSETASPATIEKQNLSFEIKGLAVGDFVFDRNHQREIAALSGDGTVYLSARGNPDSRPFTKAEKNTLRELRRSFSLNKIEMETLIVETNKLRRTNRGGAWNIAETINSGTTPSSIGLAKALFQRANASDLPTDDLLIGDGISNRVQVVKNERDAAKLNIKSFSRSTESNEVTVDSAPLAAVSLRLGIDVRPGMVVLREGQLEPEVSIQAPSVTYNVNSTADLPDDVPTVANAVCHASNGLCTLRAAIMQSNHGGGSNAILVPDGTYTLSLGPPDDEANTGGATEQSGDLDIFNWEPFNVVTGDTSPILTGVSITGGTRDGCIINMGTFAPTQAANVPNNKERILEINDGATIQSKINVTLTNLTFQNAVEPTGSGVFLDGGAIRYDGSDVGSNTNVGLLTLHNVKLANNFSAGFGGGVFAGFGSLKIEAASIVSGNQAEHKVAGGVAWTGGNTVETQTLIIDGSTIGGANVSDANTALDATFGSGAGVDARGGAGVTISNGTIIRNNIANVNVGTVGGGGIQINSPNVVFSNSTISDNKCKSNGGGVFNSARNAVTNAASTLTMTSMNVTGNQADSDNGGAGDGGGIYNFFGNLTIQTSSHIDGNSAVNGGGIFNSWSGISTDPTPGLTVNTGSTIGQAGAGNGNSAKNNGGSICISPGAATTFGAINLTSLTFSNNTANSDNTGGGDGGAIFINSGNLTSLNSCTIDSNVANGGTGDGIRQTGGTITGAGTLNFNGGDSISLSGGTFTSTSGSLNITGNLLNSGGTFTHNSGTVNFNGSSAQSIGGTTAMTFNNLLINNSSGGVSTGAETVSGTLTLTNGTLAPNAGTTLTLNGPVDFSSGAFNANATSTVNYNKSSDVQNIAPGNYGNLTFSNFTKQLPASTIRIAGTFTTGATGGHTVAGSTVEFNGSSAQTLPGTFNPYNNLTLNNVAGVTGFSGLTVQGLMRVMAGTFTSSSTYNDVQIDLGATLAGVATTIMNVSGNWTNNGTFTPNSNTVNFNGGGGQVLSGTPTSQSFSNFTMNKSGGTLSTSGGTTSLDINGGLTLTAGSFSAPATITLAGGFSQNTGTTFSPGSGTVTFDGGGAQSINGTLATKTFFNFAVNKTGGSTLSAAASTTALDINGNVTLTLGTFAAGTAAAINVAGNWTNNGGAFTGGSGTIIFDGGGGQAIGGTTATTFNSLTNSNASGLAMDNDNTVNGILGLSGSDVTVAITKTLTMPASGSSSGAFDAVGSVKRTGFVSGGSALSFGNPLNTIKIDSGTAPTDITINLARTAPAAFASAVNRTYTITPNGGTPSATLRLRYLDSELNGNVETHLDLWRFDGVNFVDQQQTARDTVNNWVEKSGVTTFSPWTLATHVNQAPLVTNATTVVNAQTTSGLVLDRNAVDVNEVTHFKITNITNGTLFKNNGTTQINNNDFITYAEGNAGLKFTPTANSTATGSFTAQGSSDNAGLGLSTGTTATITVNKGDTTTNITLDDPDPSTPGQVVTVNYTVTVNAPSSGTPGGNVVITVNDASGDTCTGTVATGTCNLTLTTAGAKTLTATYGGDTLFNGSADTEAHSVTGPPPDLAAKDAKAAEPTSGTTQMIFTVTLSSAPTSPVTVHYATADDASGTHPATLGVDYTATSGDLNFSAGEQLKTVAVDILVDADAPEFDETLLLNLSAPTGANIGDGQAVGTITQGNSAGALLISELRTSGPAGTTAPNPAVKMRGLIGVSLSPLAPLGGDSFVEFNNNSDSPLTVTASDASAGYGVFKMGTDCSAQPVLIATIPNGTVIPARGHYLVAGSGYSLSAYAAADQTLAVELEHDRNLAVFSTSNLVNVSSVTRLDAVGFGTNSGGICELLREGTNLEATGGSSLEYSFQRDQCGKGANPAVFGLCPTAGLLKDTNNNAVDFIFASTTGVGPVANAHLGAPGPENLSSPLLRNSSIAALFLDASVAPVTAPNRLRDFTVVPNGANGTLTLRRRFVNNTGGNVTRLRFRIIDISAFPVTGSIADVRALTSGSIVISGINDAATCLAANGVATTPCSVTVQGTTLEAPPSQTLGGANNSSLSAGTVTLVTPLNAGASINLQFQLGVQVTGTFKFFINVEALP